jgi:hypothetical protein
MRNIHRRMAALTLLAAMALTAAGSRAGAQAAPPAQIDRTTPHVQNGLTLLAISRGDAQGQYTFPVPQGMDFLSGPRSNGPAGGIGLWVRGVKPPAPVPQHGAKAPFYRPYYQNFQPSASAAALNGDQVPVQVELASSYSYDPRGGQPAPLYLVTVPGGYPNGYPAIDLTMNDSQGHTARWRLINLAAPYHAIVPPVAVHSSFAGAGVKLSVHAWRDTGYVPSTPGVNRFDQQRVGIHYSLAGQVPTGSHWIVRIYKRQIEWEAVRPSEMEALQAGYGPQYARHPFPRQVLWTTELGTPVSSMQNFQSPMQDMVATPYGKYNHFLRLSGEIVQIANATETVTFHNLNIHQSKPPVQYSGGRNSYVPPPSYEIGTQPQTQVTPSGISISLLPLSALGPQENRFGGYGSPDTIRMLLRFGQSPPGPSPFQQAALTLPKSPLYKKYHKPIIYTLQAQKPYFLEPFFGGFPSQGPGAPAQIMANLRLPYSPPVRTMQNGRISYRMVPPVVPKHLDSLTLNVLQRAELRTIPISFVVPISNQSPVPAYSPPRRLPILQSHTKMPAQIRR